MGWLDRLLGREDPLLDPKEPSTGTFRKSGWESASMERRAATTERYLAAVGAKLAVADMKIVPRPEAAEADLRGTVKGFPLKVTIGYSGNCSDVTFKIANTDLEYIDVEYDRDMAMKPPDVEPWEASDKQVFFAPQIFVEGSSADQEAAAFRALPEELQARVIGGMRRLGIRYFRSRREEFDITMWNDANEIDDPVAWLVETLEIALEVTRARGAVPPGQKSSSPKPGPSPAPSDVGYAVPLGRALVAALPGSKLVDRPQDHAFEVRWLAGGVPARITVDYKFNDLDVEVRADGVPGELSLEYDPDVTPEKKGTSDDPWDEIDRHVFFARSVFVHGRESVVRREAAIWQSLGSSLLEETCATMEEQRISRIGLLDQLLGAGFEDADEITDGGASAIRVAQLLARIAQALPRGVVESTEIAVHCQYCGGLWFPSPSRVTCSHCGAKG